MGHPTTLRRGQRVVRVTVESGSRNDFNCECVVLQVGWSKSKAPRPNGGAYDAFIAWENEQPSSPDINGDGAVDALDIGVMLGAWGACGATTSCPADLNHDGSADAGDLVILLAAWTP